MIMQNIQDAGLDLSKCRGQGYDGASVMSGVYSGVQQRIKEHAPNAIYIHCVCHRLNLVVHDAAECCAEMKTFFAIVEEVYKFFGLSAPNWELLKAFQTEAKNVTLKHLSSTRWESRHNSIFALIQQYSNIITSLCHLKLTSTDSSMRRNADQLSEKITTMEFLVLLFVWEKILRAVYAVSKQLQPKSVNLASSAALLCETVDFIRSLRNEFDSMCDSTEELAKKVGMKVAF